MQSSTMVQAPRYSALMHKMPLLLVLIAACGSSSSSGVDAGTPDPIDASSAIDATASIDQDEDGISDIEEGRASERDTDMDSTPDYLDTDSDNDTIPDALEAGDDDITTAPINSDDDDTPDYLDLDSDNDCISDAAEAGDTDLTTAPVDTDLDTIADYLDLDSDGDLLLDSTEDADCNGERGAGETNSRSPDTDEDGDDDLVEVIMGTDPNSADDNSRANGTPVFVSPHQAAVAPAVHELATSTELSTMDVYIVTDRSGSLTSENTALRTSIEEIATNVACAPLGTGKPGECINDIWWGTGAVGYTGNNGESFVNALDMQPDPTLIADAITLTEPPGCCAEPLLLGVHSAITGGDSTGDGTCSVATPYPARADCTGSAADLDGQGGFGYPCFRQDALSLIVLVTDEAPTQTQNCPSIPTVGTAALEAGVLVAGVNASTGAQAAVQTDLEALATLSGAVDANAANAPIVIAGANAGAAAALETAIKAVAQNAAVDVSVVVADDEGDAVDAVATFVERIETNQSGIGDCTAGLTDTDTDADAINDAYLGVLASTPLCFNIVSKTNETVEQTITPSVFRVDIAFKANGRVALGETSAFFIVPPSEPI